MKLELKDGSVIEIPDGFKDANEFIAKFNEIQSQLPTFQQMAEKAKKFEAWGDPDTLEARLTQHINQQVEAAKAAAKAEGATPRQAAAAGNEILDRWAELTPQQQIAYMQEQVSSNVEARAKQMIEGYWQEAQKQLAGSTGSTQQQFDLLARALDAKLANPKLDLPKVWEEMGKLAKATPEQLMQMAMQAATANETYTTKLAEEKAKWEEEAKKKSDAEQLKVLHSDSINSTFKRNEDRPSLNQPGGEDKMKAGILEKFLQNGSISGNQI